MKKIFQDKIRDAIRSSRAEGSLLYPAALIFVVLFVPLSDGGNTHYPWLVNRVVIFSAITAAMWRAFGGGELRAKKSLFNACWIALALLLFIETIRAKYSYAANQWLISYAAMAGLFFIAAHVGKNEKRAAWIETAYVVSGVFESVWAIAQHLSGGVSRARGTFFNASFFGGYAGAVAAIPFARILFTPKSDFLKRRNVLNILAFLAMTAGVFVSGSRGGMVALLAGMTLAGWSRIGAKIVPVLLVFLIAVIVIPNPFWRRLQSLTTQDPYAWSRLQIWQSSMAMIKDHPLGVGPGMFSYYSQKYAFAVPTFARYGKVAEKAHGSYFDFATELSPLGAVLIMGMGLYVLFLGARNASANKRVDASLWSGALAAVMTHGIFDSAQATPPSAFLGAIAAGMLWAFGSSDRPVLTFKVRRGLKWAASLLGAALILKSVAIGAAYYASRKAESVGGNNAEKWLKLTLILEPDNATYWYNRGTWEKTVWQNDGGTNRLSNAFKYMTTAMELNPVEDRFPSAYANLLNNAAPKGEKGAEMLREAARLYDAAIEIAPKNPFYYERKGEILIKLGLRKEAAVAFRKSLDLEPNYLNARRELAKLLAEDGNVGEAARQYDVLLEKIKLIPKNFTSEYERELARVNVERVKSEAARIEKTAPKSGDFTAAK